MFRKFRIIYIESGNSVRVICRHLSVYFLKSLSNSGVSKLNELFVYVFFLNETFEPAKEFWMNVFRKLLVKVRLLIHIIALNDCRNFQNAFRNRREESVSIESEKFY